MFEERVGVGSGSGGKLKKDREVNGREWKEEDVGCAGKERAKEAEREGDTIETAKEERTRRREETRQQERWEWEMAVETSDK